MYPEVTSAQDWMKNRMTVILAQTALVTAAKAMAESVTFRKATSWFNTQTDPSMDRIKLGGIHRAQPFSHQYENGKYHEYFIASWAHLRRDDQISEYEEIREARRQLFDMPEPSGGYGGGYGFSRGGFYNQSRWDDDPDMLGFYLFDPYYNDGWDGTYGQDETLSPDDAALIGTDIDGAVDAGGDSGDYGGYGSGGDGGGDGGG